MQSGHEYVQSGTSGRTLTLRWRLIKQSHTDTHTYTYSKGGTRKSIWQRWQHTSDSWNGTEQLVRWGLCLLVELLTAYGCPTEGQRQIQTVRAVVVTGFGSKFVWVLIKQPPNGETHIEPPAMAAVEAATQCGSRTLRQTVQIFANWRRQADWLPVGLGSVRAGARMGAGARACGWIPQHSSHDFSGSCRQRACLCACVCGVHVVVVAAKHKYKVQSWRREKGREEE